MKKEKIPEIDLDELKKFKEQIFKERLELIDFHIKWLKNEAKSK